MTRLRPTTLALALAALPAGALSALAADPAQVVLPWGDWLVGGANTLTAVLLPTAIAGLGGLIAKSVPGLSLFLSSTLVERLVRNATDYALNAVSGAVKGEVLTIPVGSAVIARAVQRAADQAPAWLLAAAGGRSGIAAKVFRALHLEPGATAANTLAPALAEAGRTR